LEVSGRFRVYSRDRHPVDRKVIAMASTFFQRLRAAQESRDSWLCVGLDPTRSRMPPGVDVATFGQAIVDATAPYACAYKLNLPFYLAFGVEGVQALQTIIAAVPDGLPVILDAKFGCALRGGRV